MIISKPQSGRVRTLRNWVMSFLVGLFFTAPWIVLPSGSPLVRLDIAARKFHIFGGMFIPQEGLILWFFLLTMGLSLFFFTSVIGRVWCGWACPQTIYTDFFDRLGRLVLGNKYGKKDAPKLGVSLVYGLWIVTSFFASFAWIGYFVSPYEMVADFSSASFGDKSYPYFLGFFTFAMFIDIGFIREQFCRYACPYARFQTILMDEHSFNVTYDFKRGEPRRDGKTKVGDCISCNMCVVVCPTGIDIRDGLQVGCVACGKCVDACTSIMAKENKKTLIGYFSLAQIETGQKIKWIRPRTFIYATLLCFVLSAATYKLITRIPISLIAAQNKSMNPMMLDENRLRVFVQLRIQNISPVSKSYQLEAEDTAHNRKMRLLTGETANQVHLASGELKSISVVVETESLTPSQLTESYIPGLIRVFDLSDPKIKLEKVISMRLPGT